MIPLDTGISSRQIYLDSEYATFQVGNNTSDCVWIFSEYISTPPNVSILLSVVDIEIPLAFYVINENNNTIAFTSSTGGNYTYTIAIGNYSTDDLLTELTTTVPMTTASNWSDTYSPASDLSSMTITYSHLTNKISFDASGCSTSPQDMLLSSTASEILGFTKTTTHTFESDILTSNNAVNLAGITSIYIDSNFQTQSLDSKSLSSSTILCKIPVDISSLGILVWTNATGFKTHIKESHLNVIRLRLLDPDRNLLNLNGVDWTATLQCDFVRTKVYTTSNTELAQTLTETRRIIKKK